jgi:hypothetical protein
MNVTETHTRKLEPSGLDRRSCAWRDAVGTGYATGPTEHMLEFVTRQARGSYCTTRVEPAR